jgi:hypothetical protein
MPDRALPDVSPDPRRTMEQVFKRWLYGHSLFAEEKRRLADVAHELRADIKDDWRYYDTHLTLGDPK